MINNLPSFMNRRIQFLLLFLFIFAWVKSISAQEQAKLKVTGEVLQTLQLTSSDLKALPRDTAHFKDRSGHIYLYEGVPVSAILRKAGVPLGRELRGENLSKYLLVSAADGYQVVFSLAELDSNFTDRKIILADQLEGKALPTDKGPFRLIVTGDKVPARSCYEVIGFYVGWAKED